MNQSPIHLAIRIGHVHLKVADLERALFQRRVESRVGLRAGSLGVAGLYCAGQVFAHRASSLMNKPSGLINRQ